jgi:hypothetical protein
MGRNPPKDQTERRGKSTGTRDTRMVAAANGLSSFSGHLVQMAGALAAGNGRAVDASTAFGPWKISPKYRQIICNIFPFLVAFSLGLLGVYAYGDRGDPRSIIEIQVVTGDGSLSPGTFASVLYTVHDSQECYGVVHRWIVDSNGLSHAMPDTTVFHNYSVTGHGATYQFSREFRIPRFISTGPAVYRAQTERWCNLLQWLIWPIDDNEEAKFTIVEGTSRERD